MSHLLENMNPQQQEGITTVDGPVLLLAGAGSGKTRVITHRIAYLIEERGVAADAILAVTFTNKAANEMSERVDRILGHTTLAKPMLSTFHSFCVRVLRRDVEALRINGKGLTRDFAIYDENDQQAVVKAALKRLGIDDKSLKPRTVLGKISWAKSHMIDPQEYFLASTNPVEEKIAHVFELYRKELAKANALDFDDLLLEAVRLLKSTPEVRERYNRRYRYVMIDEYQDTNRPQYELMKLLAGAESNVCVVGDEDQSIYSWRGADINNILDFEKDFPNTKTIRLEQNYRSTEVILEGASAVVANNKQRKGKTLWTSREGGVPIGYYEAPDGENEALFIADRIQSFLRQADDDSRCAVLYRTNAQSRLMEESLRRYGIQYNMVGGFSFYDRAEVKDLLSYMKLVQNPHDSIALQRVINSPARGIGKTTLETLERMALATGMSTWDAIERTLAERLLPQRALTALSGFRRLIEDARAMMNAEFAEKLAEDVQQDTELSDIAATEESAENVSDTSFDFGFDAEIAEENLGAPLMPKAWVGSEAPENSPQDSIDAASFNPFINLAPKKTRRTPPMRDKSRRGDHEWGTQNDAQHDAEPAFRKPGGPATLPELIKFLNDRSGYIRALEDEGTPESFSRIENLKELANAAQDAGQRGETLAEFLDHAALASDTDSYSADARVTLMTLHAAKGLEFPLVFLAGMEEGLFPSGRTMLDPAGLEEERRLCYVGMTRAMNTLILTRARYRRRYGSDAPEQTLGSRFLEEIPSSLIEDLGSPLSSLARPQFSGYGRPYATPYPKANQYGRGRDHEAGERHWSYEDEDQRTQRTQRASSGSSSDNIANFFSGRGEKPRKPEMADETPAAKAVLRKGNKVWHPKYGEGIVFHRDSDGDDAKITVQFLKHGMKKLVERFAQLERL